MAFNQHGHAEAGGQGFEFGQRRVIERGDDQQDGVGTHRAGFIDLIRVDHEVLAQHRQGAGGAGGLEIFRGALEKLPVSEH